MYRVTGHLKYEIQWQVPHYANQCFTLEASNTNHFMKTVMCSVTFFNMIVSFLLELCIELCIVCWQLGCSAAARPYTQMYICQAHFLHCVYTANTACWWGNSLLMFINRHSKALVITLRTGVGSQNMFGVVCTLLNIGGIPDICLAWEYLYLIFTLMGSQRFVLPGIVCTLWNIDGISEICLV